MICEFVLGQPSAYVEFLRHGSDVQWRLRHLAAEVASSGWDVLEFCRKHHGPRQVSVAGGPESQRA